MSGRTETLGTSGLTVEERGVVKELIRASREDGLFYDRQIRPGAGAKYREEARILAKMLALIPADQPSVPPALSGGRPA